MGGIFFVCDTVIVHDKSEAGVAPLVFGNPQGFIAFWLAPIISPMTTDLMSTTAEVRRYLMGNLERVRLAWNIQMND